MALRVFVENWWCAFFGGAGGSVGRFKPFTPAYVLDSALSGEGGRLDTLC